MPVTSHRLIIGGVFQLLLSKGSLGLSAYAFSKDNFVAFAVAQLLCGLIFLHTAIFSIYGGNDVRKRQCEIATAATLRWFGVLVAIAAIWMNSAALQAYDEQCENVKVRIIRHGVWFDVNEDMCHLPYPRRIHVAMIVLACLHFLCSFFSRCYKPPP